MIFKAGHIRGLLYNIAFPKKTNCLIFFGKAKGRIALLGVAKQLTQRLFNARLQRRNAFRRPGRRVLI